MVKSLTFAMLCFEMALFAVPTMAADHGLEPGAVELQSAGPLAFGPDGILFVADPQAATIYAIDTQETQGEPAKVSHDIENVSQLLSTVTDSSKVNVVDMAVNPLTGSVLVSVTAADAPALVRIDQTGKGSQLNLSEISHAKVVLPNPPADKVSGEGRRRRNKRQESITDLAYIDGKVIVTGLSSADAPSTVREIEFPFAESNAGVSLEIYHGAHGKYEDYSPVRTFIPLEIDGEINVVAGFTCTPLVRIPLSKMTPGEKVRGTTVAELGNRNRPLDMIAYKKDGKSFLLLSNSARGVMKIPTAGLDEQAPITERVGGGGIAGQKYETIESLQNVVQLDRLNDTHAVVITTGEGGTLSLATVELP